MTVHVLDHAATVIVKEATSNIKYAPQTRLNNDAFLQILDVDLSILKLSPLVYKNDLQWTHAYLLKHFVKISILHTEHIEHIQSI
jgi:hypothetical protein